MISFASVRWRWRWGGWCARGPPTQDHSWLARSASNRRAENITFIFDEDDGAGVTGWRSRVITLTPSATWRTRRARFCRIRRGANDERRRDSARYPGNGGDSSERRPSRVQRQADWRQRNCRCRTRSSTGVWSGSNCARVLYEILMMFRRNELPFQ